MTYPIFDLKSQSVLKRIKNWCNQFGYPSKILTDQGRQYIAQDIQDFFIENNIKHIKTTPFNPECNGISERLN